ncbi:GNAT family N-acetyltransferase [Kitasatospora phosalacinea]|uniref:GNAT family N-acetyltransferase n=1 Tax=Kitasatospora phosalacinea TaxID=2065 RepID=A0ABW6GKI4_9ACTN
MPELTLLRAEHAQVVLAFEVANRAYFAASVPDRGDAFFARYAERHRALLAEQEAGVCAFHLLLAEDGSVLGRFNLVDIEDGGAVLGYRVAQHAGGRGVATAAVREVCRLAAVRYGLGHLRAAAAERNAASRRVLLKTGFVPVGPAGPDDLDGAEGTWYRRELDAVAEAVGRSR